MSVVIGVFSKSRDAESAISKLEARDYNPKDISILMKDQKEAANMASKTGADIVEGTAAGAGTGAIVGGITGLLAGTILPGLGGLLIAGPIGAALGLTGAAATTVSGAATGAVAGGLIGALTGTFGLSENEAKEYETEIKRGGILVAVPARSGEEEEVRGMLADFDADNVRVVSSADARRSRPVDDSQYYQMGAKGGRAENDEWIE